jgi:hypothetical protein
MSITVWTRWQMKSPFGIAFGFPTAFSPDPNKSKLRPALPMPTRSNYADRLQANPNLEAASRC